jgi:hypothetical protein
MLKKRVPVRRRKIGGAILYGLIGFIIYFFAFPRNTGKDVVLVPGKFYDFSTPVPVPVNVNIQDGVSSFRAGDQFGFVDGEGRVLFHDAIDFSIALSDSGFINYSSIQEGEQGLVYRNYMGDLKSSFQLPGYPVLGANGERLLLVKTDATGVTDVAIDGGVEWSASFASVVTAIAMTDHHTLVGLLSGNLKLFDHEGRSIYGISFRSTKSETIYGCAIANHARELAVVCGTTPQRLVLIRKGGSSFEKPASRDLSSDFRRPVFIEFSEDGKLIFIEGKGKVLVADTDSLSLNEIPVSGTFAGMSVAPRLRYAAVLGQNRTDRYIDYDLRMFYLPRLTFVREKFTALNASIKFFSRFLLAGIDDRLIILAIREV